MEKKIKISIVIMFIMMITSITVSAATLINSKEVIYDNKESGMKSTNVQAAVDELYSAATDYSSLKERIENLESSLLDKTYPVGSIYISTEDDTIEKVKERFGGTWQRYAEGRTLIGVGTSTDENGNVSTYTKNQVGGIAKEYIEFGHLPSELIVDGGDAEKKNLAASYWADYSNYKYVTTHLSTYYKEHFGDYKKTPLDNVQPYITTYMYKRIK